MLAGVVLYGEGGEGGIGDGGVHNEHSGCWRQMHVSEMAVGVGRRP